MFNRETEHTGRAMAVSRNCHLKGAERYSVTTQGVMKSITTCKGVPPRAPLFRNKNRSTGAPTVGRPYKFFSHWLASFNLIGTSRRLPASVSITITPTCGPGLSGLAASIVTLIK